MPETQSTSSQVSAPTGDIKIFIDTFNKEFDNEIKKLNDDLVNLKNIYADAIKISTPKTTTWPKDENVKTIGDLFKYTFPDIEKGTFVEPPKGVYSNGLSSTVNQDEVDARKAWEKDLNTAKEFFTSLKRGRLGSTTLSHYNEIKKPGVTNPSLYSPGQYYFDVFMNVVLDEYGPLKKPSSSNGGDAFDFDYKQNPTYGGSVSITQFDPSGEVEISKHDGSLNDVKFDYYEFRELVQGGYVGSAVYDQVKTYTGINIDLDNDGFRGKYSGSFPGLRTQYRSGDYDQLKTNPKFNESRGDFDKTTKEFWGGFELISLYKAFLQAGDNYKTVVLPRLEIKPIPETSNETPDIKPKVEIDTDEWTFNVEKIDTFKVVGGSASGQEFTIVKSDGVTQSMVDDNNLTDNFTDTEEIDEEYGETSYSGQEEDPVKLAEAMVVKNNLQSDIPSDTKSSDFNVDETKIDYNDPSFSGPQWKSFNIDSVVSAINKTKHKPSKQFTESLKKVLYFIKQDPEIKDLREGAYLLGTAFAESGYSLQRWEADYACKSTGVKYGPNGPCNSALNYYRSSDGKSNYYNLGTDSKGFPYFGRGLIQLTGKDNYEKYGKLIGVDLVGNGDLAIDPQNSYKVASIYMRGRTFKYLLDPNAKFTTKKGSWTGLEAARRSVNGGTKGLEEVNGAYNDWVNVLKQQSGSV